MKRVALVVSVLSVSLLAVQPMARQGGKKKPGGGGGLTPLALSVTIEDTDSDNKTCDICSDGFGDYVDGQEGVSAQFDEWGNLIVSFGQRNVDFSFEHSDLAGISGSHVSSYIATRFTPALQDLAEGEENSVCAEMNWVFRDATDQYKLLFQRDGGGPLADVDASAWAVVTRVGPDTWSLEPRACNPPPDGRSIGADDSAAIVSLPNRGKANVTSYGTEQMPFKLTLSRK
jgi:hypothetical protein